MNLDFQKSDGLVTAVIQDYNSGRVLMVGFMNEEAFRKTVETGFATFYSRSRRKLWLIISLVSNFGFLGYFKYAYFITDNWNALFGRFHMLLPNPVEYPNAILRFFGAGPGMSLDLPAVEPRPKAD